MKINPILTAPMDGSHFCLIDSDGVMMSAWYYTADNMWHIRRIPEGTEHLRDSLAGFIGWVRFNVFFNAVKDELVASSISVKYTASPKACPKTFSLGSSKNCLMADCEWWVPHREHSTYPIFTNMCSVRREALILEEIVKELRGIRTGVLGKKK